MSLKERLENWARYYRTRMKLETCASIEKRYQAPYRQWLELHEIHIPDSVDMWDAQKVEAAWKTLSFRHKMILKWHYITKRDPRNVAVRLKIPQMRHKREFQAAHAAIREVLAIQNELEYKDTKSDPRLVTPLTSMASVEAIGV